MRRCTMGVAAAVLFGAAAAGCAGPDASSGAGSAADSGAALVVHTADGTVRGTANGAVRRFRGIPYAQPPTGALRWTSPRPVRPWPGVRAADRSGQPCPQPGATPRSGGTGSEDCLHLDITAPAHPPGTSLPVVVFLHGGGFSVGTGADYDPARMVTRGTVVAVTVDFRLGVMANLALPGMPDGGTFGLQDQQQALRWLHGSVAAFGGDPDNITLAGQSGGAIATCGQLTSPAARDLFAKAIMASGSCRTTLTANASGAGVPATGTFWRPMSQAEHTGATIAAALRCPDPATALSCLRRVPLATLLTQSTSATAAAYGGPTLPTDPARAPAARPGRPVLSSHTHDEQRMIADTYRLTGKPITADQYPALLRAGFGDRAGAIAREYPVTPRTPAELAWADAYTDSGFVCPQLRTNQRFAASGPVYGYEFADPTAPLLYPSVQGFAQAASHASDMFYVFDQPGKPLRIDGTTYQLTATQRRLADTMIDTWTTFARTGTPGPSGAWPRWREPDPAEHQFTADPARPRTVDPATEHHCSFWATS